MLRMCAAALLLSGCAQAVPGFGGPLATVPSGHRQAGTNLTLGGFNEARGGQQSLQDPAVSGLKAAIAHAFPGVVFKFSAKLTHGFFNKVNAVLLGVGKSPTSGIKPLSKQEQRALANFVGGGGEALIFTDNDTFDAMARAENDSLLRPFGLSATGTLDGNQTATFLQSNDPIANGPFGSISQLDMFYPGWYAKTGSCIVIAALIANSEPALCYIPAHRTGGAAVFFADSSLLFDSVRTANDQTAILNALALAP
jgi:hypothetical protein